jgi:small-conductance mechanosensitive channel
MIPVELIQAELSAQWPEERQFLETAAENLVKLLGSLLGQMAGFDELKRVLSEPFALHALASVVLLGVLFLLHASVFSILRRRAASRREHQGNEDRWVLGIEAARPPLKLAFWLGGIYLAALPLLLLWPAERAGHPGRSLAERILAFGLFAALYWFFYRLIRAGEVWAQRWTETPPGSFQESIIQFVGRSLRVVVPVAWVILGLPLLDLPPAHDFVVGKISSLLIVGAIAWMLCQIVSVGEQFVITRYSVMAPDNLRARRIYTQAVILRKTLYVVITVFAVASALMLFDQVRTLGASVLASAGVLGVIIGFAAQRTMANLFAGFQLALTQPIRLDDVVIVENEFGRVEEITLTYVVVQLWDLRRLIVPLSHFIEHPFQNWTRTRADVIGSVFIYADYTVPVQPLREELIRIVAQSKHWDGQVCHLQVTNATERAVELRAIASAPDAAQAWDLRCEIREQLIAFLQKNFPDALPRVRAALQPSGEFQDDLRPGHLVENRRQ